MTDWENYNNYVVRFGKYGYKARFNADRNKTDIKYKTFDEVFKTDGDYCKWCLKQEDFNNKCWIDYIKLRGNVSDEKHNKMIKAEKRYLKSIEEKGKAKYKAGCDDNGRFIE